jgi:predicted ArsR family transcriptional regulator
MPLNKKHLYFFNVHSSSFFLNENVLKWPALRIDSALSNDNWRSDIDTQRTKDRLLLLLKTRGELSTKALARELGISVPAVRRHLQTLGDQVLCESQVSGVGRPSQIWRLGASADDRFPDTHAELTVKLLDSIEHSLGKDALDRIIDDRFHRSLAGYRARLDGAKSLAGRLKRLADIRSEEGYMAHLEKQTDGWLLVESHCPICAAATRCQGFCRNELQLFRDLLGDDVCVERVEYLLQGGQRCAYSVRANSKAKNHA